MSFHILYIFPFDFYGFANNSFLTVFNRISNYINARRGDLKCDLKELYLDLRHENLPSYHPKNINQYRQSLQKLLFETYDAFPFDIVAISCYSSFSYINSIEVASIIKHIVNPNCTIIVGGPHASICPDDFQSGGIPEIFTKVYSKNTTPFDYLIKGEGEIPFFNLIKSIIDKEKKMRNLPNRNCLIIKPELINNLDHLPIINLDLYKRYKDILNREISSLNIEFSRGCMFRCNFCPNSAEYINFYKNVRLKSVKKCIEELRAIRDTEWLEIKHVFINDMLFLPKNAVKKEFFNEMTKLIAKEGYFPFQIEIEDRVDFCSEEDLINYKKIQIIPQFGLESASKTLLFRAGKILGKNKIDILKGLDRYLEKTKLLIIKSNELDIPITFFYVIGLPGTDKNTIKESRDFLFKKRKDGKSFMESYKINLRFAIYHTYKGTFFYDNANKLYGTRMLFEDWWKVFTEDQYILSQMVEPSQELSLPGLISEYSEILKKIFKTQKSLNNKFYTGFKYMIYKRQLDELLSNYKKILDII